jgi:hypothetical protein
VTPHGVDLDDAGARADERLVEGAQFFERDARIGRQLEHGRAAARREEQHDIVARSGAR